MGTGRGDPAGTTSAASRRRTELRYSAPQAMRAGALVPDAVADGGDRTNQERLPRRPARAVARTQVVASLLAVGSACLGTVIPGRSS